MGTKNRLSPTLGLFAVVLLFAAVDFGGIGGCGSAAAGGGVGDGGGDEGTRGLTGALPVSLPAPLTLRSKSQSTDLACTDIQVCCLEYGNTEATPAAIDVGSDCSFDLPLPLNAYYACYLASGADEDGDGCKDDYVGSMGCSADGYSGAIPVFPDADGGTDDIDLGTSSIEGEKVVAANDPCAQVDQDGDGTPDSEDSDSDGDGTDDADDVFHGPVCADLCKMDGNENGVPDCLELGDVATETASDSFFDLFFADSDGDMIPDGCDLDIGCPESADDADGDCIPDNFDACALDDDNDGLPNCLDCDKSDASTTTGCHEECTGTDCVDFCAVDNDGDGFGLCTDCDDQNPTVALDCFGANYCQTDSDGDGFGFCFDCSDSTVDASTTTATSCHGDYCLEDSDGDGVLACQDCNDWDAGNTVTIDAGCCSYDYDGDGVGICADCNDFDALISSMTDADDDHVDSCIDCDDSDASVGYSCYSASITGTGASVSFCDGDDDGDTVGNCDDCKPFDSSNAINFNTGGNCCDIDADGDGSNVCNDCNDFDPDLENLDVDNDGVSTCMGDCDDNLYGTISSCGGETASYCSQDFDGDGVDHCSDCNDYSYANNKSIPNCCDFDGDGDGIGNCSDCNDYDYYNTISPCSSSAGYCGDLTCSSGETTTTCPVDCAPPTAAFNCSLVGASFITCYTNADCMAFQSNSICSSSMCFFPCSTNTECNAVNASRSTCTPTPPTLSCTGSHCS